MSPTAGASQLWVGLGNPGEEYERTRHNIGFMALAALAEAHKFSPFKSNKKVFSEVSEGRLGGVAVRLLLPQTFMNESGRAVLAAARFWGYEPASILVFHDELDLVAGKLRLKQGGGDAGHKGLGSITSALQTPDYRRLRIGIDARPVSTSDRQAGLDYVLSAFSRHDRDTWLDGLLQTITDQAALLISNSEADNNRFINAVHNTQENATEE